jgi:hypothetical protein
LSIQAGEGSVSIRLTIKLLGDWWRQEEALIHKESGHQPIEYSAEDGARSSGQRFFQNSTGIAINSIETASTSTEKPA